MCKNSTNKNNLDICKEEFKNIENNSNKNNSNKNDLNKATEICDSVQDENDNEYLTIEKFLTVKIYKKYSKETQESECFVDIIFKKDSESHPLSLPFKDVLNSKVFNINLIKNMPICIPQRAFINYVEKLYNEQKCIEVINIGFNIENEADDYYHDLLEYIEENKSEFVTKASNKFDSSLHKGVFLNDSTVAVTNTFLNEEIWVSDFYGEIKPISPNEKGKLLNLLIKRELLIPKFKSRKDVKMHLRADESDKKLNVYIFKLKNLDSPEEAM